MCLQVRELTIKFLKYMCRKRDPFLKSDLGVQRCAQLQTEQKQLRNCKIKQLF